MVQLTRIHKNEKGQSAIEFILTFAFSLGFVFLFVNLALNLTAGYLNHYVNFMAARSYLVQDPGVNVEGTVFNYAKTQATKTFDKYPMDKFGIDAEFKVIETGTRGGLYVGTTSKFEKALSSMPVVGSSEKAKLLSESFLGKEPSRITCFKMVCAAITGTPDCNEAKEYSMVLYDNGC